MKNIVVNKSNKKILRRKKRIKKILRKNIKKLDVDPQRDDDASPMSTYRCMLRPT